MSATERLGRSNEKFEDLNRAIRFERGHGFPGRVWDQGKTLWIEDVSEDRDFGRAQAALDEGLRSVLAFPITLGPEVLGVMEIFSKEVRQPEPELLEAQHWRADRPIHGEKKSGRRKGAPHKRADTAAGLRFGRDLWRRSEWMRHLHEPGGIMHVPMRPHRSTWERLPRAISPHASRRFRLCARRLRDDARFKGRAWQTVGYRILLEK